MRFALVAVLLASAPLLRAETYRVTSGADDGSPGTLRWAIQSANERAGSDSIVFNVTSIRPVSPLPVIRGEVNLNTGAGYLENVEIDGSLAGDASGLVVEGPAYLHNLVVNRFARNGIEIRGSGVTVVDCRVGTTRDRAPAAAPNGGEALLIEARESRIVTSSFCSSATGIRIRGSNNTLLGNSIGLCRPGEEGFGNRGDGLVIEEGATGNTVGRFLDYCVLCGVRPATNFIGTNGGNGIVVRGEANSVINNGVGSYFSDFAFGNGANGIVVTGRNNRIEGNDVSFNGENGVVILRESNSMVRNLRGRCNGRLFIDIDGDGPTANDRGDSDGIPNRPELSGAVADAGATTIEGTLDALPNARYTSVVLGFQGDCRGIEGPDTSSTSLLTDSSGHALFRAGVPSAAARVVAYVIDPAGMPSEASEIVATQRGEALADLAAQIAVDHAAFAGEPVSITVTITNHGPATVPAVWPVTDFPGTEYVSSVNAPCYPWCVLAAGESATWTFRYTLARTGTFRWSATANTVDAYADPNRENDSASTEITSRSPRRRSAGR
jgi:hypothetical protein